MSYTIAVEPGTVIDSVEGLAAVPDLSILIDNRWDLWRVTGGGRATLHGGRRNILSAPWEQAVKGQAGIFPFQVLWTPRSSTI